jgi:hypothetical protein
MVTEFKILMGAHRDASPNPRATNTP